MRFFVSCTDTSGVDAVGQLPFIAYMGCGTASDVGERDNRTGGIFKKIAGISIAIGFICDICSMVIPCYGAKGTDSCKFGGELT